jgi:dTDP-4-dehydrorhamnose 3,5-epimerase-like enzyme
MSLSDCVKKVPPVSKNERRTIWEPVNGVLLQRIQAFQFFSSQTSGGNHYHKQLTEYFFVIRGCMTVLVLEDVQTKNRHVFRDLGPESLIVVPPYVAHANCFEDGTIVMCGCTTTYDPDDPDTYPYPLLDQVGQEIAPAR